MIETISHVPIPSRRRRRDARQIAQLLRQVVGERFCLWLTLLEWELAVFDWLRRRGSGPRR